MRGVRGVFTDWNEEASFNLLPEHQTPSYSCVTANWRLRHRFTNSHTQQYSKIIQR